MGFVYRQSVLASLVVVDYRGWIVYSFFTVLFVAFEPIMDIAAWDWGQLWNPFFNVHAIFIVSFLLSPRIEYAEVWCSIGPIANRPLPPSRILHGRIID